MKGCEDKFARSLHSLKYFKALFSYAKYQGLDVTKGISLIGDSGEMGSETESANIFLGYFASVFIQPMDRGTYIEPVVISTVNHLDDVLIGEEWFTATCAFEHNQISRSR
ncbi:hypothetical protein LOD99_3092 [Oopsacas minuta]|uniref:Uncharacterized protein n=1 Tax=Oopsacas minuta TaxID=111878 RepID=A0AAV7JYD0_9METZ|nr:hypothetical protein LOD99_3092 [Oopsacas minuta]